MRHTLIAVSLAASASLVALPAASHAQQPRDPMLTTTRYQLAVVRVKPERVREWVAVHRDEVAPALKKAGVPMRTVVATSMGESFEFSIITRFPRWETLDAPSPLEKALGADGARKLNEKLESMIRERRTFLVFAQDSLSRMSPKGLVWRMSSRTFVPGKREEFTQLYRDEVLPVMKKAVADGVIAGFSYAWGAAGAEPGQMFMLETYPTFGSQDNGNPLQRVLGAEGAAALNQKIDQFLTPGRLTVSRVLPELSW